jgi:hypothetical protein
MMKFRNCLPGVCSTLLLVFVAQAQQTPLAPSSPDSIEVGGMTLQLGMTQNAVIQGLSANYNLHEIGSATDSGSTWAAETKAGPPYLAVANVSFVGGQLSSVYKFWTVGSQPPDNAGFAGTLYGAVARFEQENKSPCEITTNTSQQPAGELKATVVTCGDGQKSLRINIVPMGNGQEGVSLAEVLMYPADEIMVPGQIPVAGDLGAVPSSSSPSTQSKEALVESPREKTLAPPRVERAGTDSWVPPDVDEDKPQVEPGAACPLTNVLSKAGKRVEELVSNVEKFTATEVVEHQSVNKSGQLHTPDIRKFNYLVSISKTPSGRLNVEEYRDGGSDPDQFPEHVATVGTPSLALIFHPEHVNDFTMTCEGLGQWQDQPAWQVRFEERTDTKHPTSAFVINGRTFSLRLRGRAWILANSYQVGRLETDLAAEIPEVRLRLQHEDIQYRPVYFDAGKTEMWLPVNCELYMDFRGHRFYRRHQFTDFKLFSVGLEQSLGDPKN